MFGKILDELAKPDKMKRLLQHMVMKIGPPAISCEQAAFLVSKKQHVRLNLRESISLRVHFMMCKICKIYEKEIRLISEKIRAFRRTEKSGMEPHVKLPEEKKQELSQRLKNALNK